MKTQLVLENNRTYVCTLDDFNDIIEIHNARKKVRDFIKTPEYNNFMAGEIKRILENGPADEVIVATRDTLTNRMLSYSIAAYSKDFLFQLVTEAVQIDNAFLQADRLGISNNHRLINDIALNRKIFNMLTCVKLNSALAIMSNLKFENSNYIVGSKRFDVRIHSIIKKGQESYSSIEKVFMKMNPEISRTDTDWCIIHGSILNQFRLEYL